MFHVDFFLAFDPSLNRIALSGGIVCSLGRFVTMEGAAAEHQYERTRIRRAKRLAADFLNHLEAAEKKAIEDGQVW